MEEDGWIYLGDKFGVNILEIHPSRSELDLEIGAFLDDLKTTAPVVLKQECVDALKNIMDPDDIAEIMEKFNLSGIQKEEGEGEEAEGKGKGEGKQGGGGEEDEDEEGKGKGKGKGNGKGKGKGRKRR